MEALDSEYAQYREMVRTDPAYPVNPELFDAVLLAYG